MKVFKKVLLAAAACTAMGAAQASMINVAGVAWNPDAVSDFTAQSVNMRQFISSTDGELSGFGIITVFNGTSQAIFCASGCELTFQFGNFMPTGGVVVPGSGIVANYSGGYVNVYAGAAEISNPFDYDSLTWANTGNGTLFLGLLNNYNFVGTNVGDSILSGLGYLDVAAGASGGAARSNFDTNTQTLGSDIKFTTSLSYQRIDLDVTDVSGTGNFRGTSIPEPASLALVGLGLLGLAAARRRKSVK